MHSSEEGDRVRIDIPDETDTEHDLHGQHATVTAVLEDGAGSGTGGPRDGVLYRVRLEDGGEVDPRPTDARPPSDNGESPCERGTTRAHPDAELGGSSRAS